MSGLLQAIGDILKPEMLIRQSPIVLQEDHPGSTCEPITLKTTGNVVVLKSDHPSLKPFPLFRDDRPGATRMCDYIIFYAAPAGAPRRSPGQGRRLFVFLCELKTGKTSGALEQIVNGYHLAGYIVSMARSHFGVHENPAVFYRGLIFSTGMKAAKQQTTPVPQRWYRDVTGVPGFAYAHFACGITQRLELLCGR